MQPGGCRARWLTCFSTILLAVYLQLPPASCHFQIPIIPTFEELSGLNKVYSMAPVLPILPTDMSKLSPDRNWMRCPSLDQSCAFVLLRVRTNTPMDTSTQQINPYRRSSPGKLFI